MTEEQEAVGGEIQDFILSRELAEVYLLLDHISAAKDKSIPRTLDDEPVFADGGGRTWLQQICEIAWPPEDSTREADARNAARLVRAKDILNSAAAPATGGSIAFTLMMAGEAREPQLGHSWWKRVLMWMGDFGPPAQPPTASGDVPAGWPGGRRPPSRASLASLAFPNLSRRAWRYRLALYFILIFLVLWLVLTCVLSWDIATGNSLLKRVNTLEARVETLQSAARDTRQVDAQGGTGDRREEGAPDNAQAAVPDGTPSPSATPTARNDLTRIVELRDQATDNLGRWLEHRGVLRTILVERMGGATELSRITPGQASSWADDATTEAQLNPAARSQLLDDAAVEARAPARTNSEWAAVLLAVLASNILPIFYGLLGAGAAVVRLVSAKMRDSLLTPRDILLAYVQLALGAVIGSCIGLFVNSNGDAATTEEGLLGSVHLSASALCFVAGFGVEGVFQALESLIRRVFNLEPPRAAVSG